MSKLSIIVTAYNEEHTIGSLLEQLFQIPLEKQVIVVDDGSTDRTPQIVQRQFSSQPLIFLSHKHNRGKGAAIQHALEKVTGDYVAIQDADLEYDPQDLVRMFQILEERKLPVIYGSRFLEKRGRHFFWSRFGNRMVTWFTNLLFGATLSDIETCYKMISVDLVRSLPLRESGFGIDPEITSNILKQKVPILEIPISYHARPYQEGKKITWYDGIEALWVILRVRLSAVSPPLRKSQPVLSK